MYVIFVEVFLIVFKPKIDERPQQPNWCHTSNLSTFGYIDAFIIEMWLEPKIVNKLIKCEWWQGEYFYWMIIGYHYCIITQSHRLNRLTQYRNQIACDFFFRNGRFSSVLFFVHLCHVQCWFAIVTSTVRIKKNSFHFRRWLCYNWKWQIYLVSVIQFTFLWVKTSIIVQRLQQLKCVFSHIHIHMQSTR